MLNNDQGYSLGLLHMSVSVSKISNENQKVYTSIGPLRRLVRIQGGNFITKKIARQSKSYFTEYRVSEWSLDYRKRRDKKT